MYLFFHPKQKAWRVLIISSKNQYFILYIFKNQNVEINIPVAKAFLFNLFLLIFTFSMVNIVAAITDIINKLYIFVFAFLFIKNLIYK